jgi:hypothetical protein
MQISKKLQILINIRKRLLAILSQNKKEDLFEIGGQVLDIEVSCNY